MATNSERDSVMNDDQFEVEDPAAEGRESGGRLVWTDVPLVIRQSPLHSDSLVHVIAGLEGRGKGTAAYITYEWGKDSLVDGANDQNKEFVIFEDASTGKKYHSSDPKVVSLINELKDLINAAKKNGRELDIAMNVREPEETLEGYSYATKPPK